MSLDAASFAWDCRDQARCRATGCCSLPGATSNNMRASPDDEEASRVQRLDMA